jgi:hypothetical protein
MEEDTEMEAMRESLSFLSRNMLLEVNAESIGILETIVGRECVKLTISMD